MPGSLSLCTPRHHPQMTGAARGKLRDLFPCPRTELGLSGHSREARFLSVGGADFLKLTMPSQ